VNRLPLILVASTLALALAVPSPLYAQSSSPLGLHTVRSGETLYCLGRTYGVKPAAITQTNRMTLNSLLQPGRVLSIPAVRWENIPAGPVCAAQFASPYVAGGAPATLTADPSTSVPARACPGATCWSSTPTGRARSA
jgi:LysM repeat protein